MRLLNGFGAQKGGKSFGLGAQTGGEFFGLDAPLRFPGYLDAPGGVSADSYFLGHGIIPLVRRTS
jgi:hypothetical protein